jgi:hypothetical protein
VASGWITPRMSGRTGCTQFGMSKCVGHVVSVGFFVFLLSIGVALLLRRWRVKAVTAVSARGTEMSSVCGLHSDLA